MLAWDTWVHVHGCVPFLREGPLGCSPACLPPLPHLPRKQPMTTMWPGHRELGLGHHLFSWAHLLL